jgi:hypothetical protein
MALLAGYVLTMREFARALRGPPDRERRPGFGAPILGVPAPGGTVLPGFCGAAGDNGHRLFSVSSVRRMPDTGKSYRHDT